MNRGKLMVNLALKLSCQEPHDNKGKVKISEILQQNSVEDAAPFQGGESSDEYVLTDS